MKILSYKMHVVKHSTGKLRGDGSKYPKRIIWKDTQKSTPGDICKVAIMIEMVKLPTQCELAA